LKQLPFTFALLLMLIALPLLWRGEEDVVAPGARTLIIITPHNEQIRHEFGLAFAQWHREKFGEEAAVVWSVPGGTSEIRRMLEAQYRRALIDGTSPGGNADMVFGGGTYEHKQLAKGVEANGSRLSISEPVLFTEEELLGWYGEREIAGVSLWHPEGYWYGTALSGFGLYANREVLTRLEVPMPATWADLAHPRLDGWVAMANPAQSSSVTSAFQAMLSHVGWEDGWRILRRSGAGARYFSASSLRPPSDIAQGDAGAGVCIDFYGRYAEQALREVGAAERTAYVDPPGASTIDPDPISMLRGARDPELAKRFIAFTLSDAGQALWQLPPVAPDSKDSAALGPRRFTLRRLPICRPFIRAHMNRMIDPIDPFEVARKPPYEDRNARDFIVPLYAAMVMDEHDRARAAWQAIYGHPEHAQFVAQGHLVVRAEEARDDRLKRMLLLFDAMPTLPGPDGREYALASTASLGVLKAGWLGKEWEKAGLWHAGLDPAMVLRRRFAEFFRRQYDEILRLASTDAVGAPP